MAEDGGSEWTQHGQGNCTFSMAFGAVTSAQSNSSLFERDNSMITIMSGRHGGTTSGVEKECYFDPQTGAFHLDSSSGVVSVRTDLPQFRYRVKVTLAKPRDGCDGDWIRISSDKCAKIIKDYKSSRTSSPCSEAGAQLMTLSRKELDIKLQEIILSR